MQSDQSEMTVSQTGVVLHVWKRNEPLAGGVNRNQMSAEGRPLPQEGRPASSVAPTSVAPELSQRPAESSVMSGPVEVTVTQESLAGAAGRTQVLGLQEVPGLPGVPPVQAEASERMHPPLG